MAEGGSLVAGPGGEGELLQLVCPSAALVGAPSTPAKAGGSSEGTQGPDKAGQEGEEEGLEGEDDAEEDEEEEVEEEQGGQGQDGKAVGREDGPSGQAPVCQRLLDQWALEAHSGDEEEPPPPPWADLLAEEFGDGALGLDVAVDDGGCFGESSSGDGSTNTEEEDE